MIKLKEILNPTYLYHFTTPSFFKSIISQNRLKTSDGVISFTVEPDLWIFKDPGMEDEEIVMRLKFNFNDIQKRADKLYSYVDTPQFEEPLEHEKEWRYEGRDIINVKNILISIKTIVDDKDFMNQLAQFCNKYNITVDQND